MAVGPLFSSSHPTHDTWYALRADEDSKEPVQPMGEEVEVGERRADDRSVLREVQWEEVSLLSFFQFVFHKK